MVTKSQLVWVLRQIHLATVIFVLFGWLLPSPNLRLFHLVFVPLMILQWRFNKGDCLLTNLENYLLHEEKRPQEESAFTRSLLKWIGVEPSQKNLIVFIYVTVCAAWGLNLMFYLG